MAPMNPLSEATNLHNAIGNVHLKTLDHSLGRGNAMHRHLRQHTGDMLLPHLLLCFLLKIRSRKIQYAILVLTLAHQKE